MLGWLKRRFAAPETRSAGNGYTAQLINARAAWITGPGGAAELTATVQACVSLWESGLSAADVTGTTLLDRHTLALIGRAVALRGEAVLLIAPRGLSALAFAEPDIDTAFADLHARFPAADYVRDDSEARAWAERIFQGGGPGAPVPLALYGLIVGEATRLQQGERQAWAMWVTHGFFLVLMFGFIERYSALSSLHYLAFGTVPALAISMVRSYYEHRPSEQPQQRTVINEASWPWGWLFLNLNLHLVHHDLPGLSWYHIPQVYRARREQWLARSGGFLVPGYAELFRRHSFSPIDSPQHPYV